jgi:hypothetical protein
VASAPVPADCGRRYLEGRGPLVDLVEGEPSPNKSGREGRRGGKATASDDGGEEGDGRSWA